MKEKIILVGAGGHTRSCIDVIESEGKYSILGLIGSQEEVGTNILGYEVIGTDQDLEKLKQDCKNAMVTVGQIKDSSLRIQIFQRLKILGFNLPIIVSPIAHFSRYSTIGEGSIIMHHAIVNSNVQVGKNCVINSKVLLEHDVKIGDYCHISTGSVLNGEVVVGEASFIGSGSVIKEAVKIGSHCVVAMASKVIRNLPDHSVYKVPILNL
ncbi:sugar O-acyltransferase, sialic acid O-acetyltransferase NeuD family [Leptospira weilii serovar Topaz str. LT2116]|uniref:Sugar O-acyltransferase, sialic acid O-acetyltransferase NeuD family n=1 Tax=Leptospira weilii serovar Topaz str. LT2116 TaxID=1088540 RepID=M3GV33_9LEPT|nr:sugar O-acyltransferase, sialic acid O-acetyltransferase NeuD family [Leptospira weilii serovar Topaz str. LT2116]